MACQEQTVFCPSYFPVYPLFWKVSFVHNTQFTIRLCPVPDRTGSFLRSLKHSKIVVEGRSCIAPITDREMYDSCLIYSIEKNKHAKDSLVWNPMSEDWKQNCKNRFWFQDTVEEAVRLHPQMDRRLFDLKERLLSFAGEAVCLTACEPDLENIMDYGQFWLGYNAKKKRGEDCHCHSNSAMLWEVNKDKTVICTGYALSADGMWRQHSWLIHTKPRSNRVVETTRPRILYYGFAMTPEMCEEFADKNI